MPILSCLCIVSFIYLFKYAAKEAVGENETPCGGWLVTRLRSAAHGTLNIPGLALEIGPKGGLGEQGDSVSRQLILTKASLVERRPENYEVCLSVHFIIIHISSFMSVFCDLLVG